ncbi:anti-anti-sigma factor [Arcticibacter pallidicorallinus]|uniref:Anti-sigma factor antagonist n=1 Tax=Arcticibacter pallidicorallinus TaxID=1259464 RepID=A0A2T0U3A8_9SPHI|nr:anti-sigma factor antagonist [Arcticibacter pallidicorallinus]PRY52396.1 anti-anti-sigma factor [Arcticibacter pallidicorallinus]
MKYTLDRHEKYVLIILEEKKLNSLISPKLKSEMILINTEGIRNIILDLSHVLYSDSSGLSSLLVGHRLCKNSAGSFIISGLSESVERLIQISQLQDVLSITQSVEEAIDLLFMEEIERDLNRSEE